MVFKKNKFILFFLANKIKHKMPQSSAPRPLFLLQLSLHLHCSNSSHQPQADSCWVPEICWVQTGMWVVYVKYTPKFQALVQKYFQYLSFLIFIKLISPFFSFSNVATRKFKVTYVAGIQFLLDSTAYRQVSPSTSMTAIAIQVRMTHKSIATAQTSS